MSIKDNNLKVDKTIFGRVKKVNTTLYVAENRDGTEANLINAYTNKIIMNLDINRYAKGLKRYNIYKSQNEFVYVTRINECKNYIFDILGNCILKLEDPLYYLPVYYKTKDNKTLISLCTGGVKSINVIYVYDDKQFKLVKRIGNITTMLHVGKTGLKLIYIDKDDKLTTDIFELNL